MRQSKTLKSAVIIGATALLGIGVTVGAAHAGGADTPDTTKPAPFAKVVNKQTGKSSNVPLKEIGKDEIGEGAMSCAVPLDGDGAGGVAFKLDSAGKPGKKTPVKLISKGKSDGKSAVCSELVEGKPAAPNKVEGKPAAAKK
ncbi:hypothetical protein [Wenjunlia tyrosinilytica]|uniref:Uncharacterized protein n=1 Tax=Wenjunlia tyrosinilytica TaxID=1544741 RepID=A0A918E2P4_9ACTN|nr:hypothetical protein [Wenjunlia tyrosinilytica]GGP00114.1 hypothetical protein GCM10012280_68120 [Wenjunlia tyrosinilytica]